MSPDQPAGTVLGLAPYTVYRAFKYTVYALLSFNIFLFFRDDLAAATQVFGDAVTWRNVVEAYSATIDTAAWVVLLLLFELETAVIPDDKLRGGLKWLLLAIRSVCYFFIVYAFYGYCAKYAMISQHAPLAVDSVCALVGTAYTYVFTLDEYFPITAEACSQLSGQPLMQVVGTHIIGTSEALTAATRLAMVDIINAGDWLVVVALLEAEVLLQIRQALTRARMRLLKWIKGVLYSVLFGCAIYWGFEGDFLDFWDAFLWLVAFIFIEMNIFEWHAETLASP